MTSLSTKVSAERIPHTGVGVRSNPAYTNHQLDHRLNSPNGSLGMRFKSYPLRTALDHQPQSPKRQFGDAFKSRIVLGRLPPNGSLGIRSSPTLRQPMLY